MLFGVGSAVFLITHSIFLGISFENDLYKFFRRFVLLSFIIFEIIAQSLLVINIFRIKEDSYYPEIQIIDINKIINNQIDDVKLKKPDD